MFAAVCIVAFLAFKKPAIGAQCRADQAWERSCWMAFRPYAGLEAGTGLNSAKPPRAAFLSLAFMQITGVIGMTF